MKKVLIFLVIIISLAACSKWDSSKEKFVNVYKDILVARVRYSDSVQADKEVNNILIKNGYSLALFKAKYIEYSGDHDGFMAMMDSARTRAAREINGKEKY